MPQIPLDASGHIPSAAPAYPTFESAGATSANAPAIPRPMARPDPVTGLSPDSPLAQFGPMQGHFQLLPQYQDIVPQGQPRPMGLGEYIVNPARGDYQGGWSSEMTHTVQDPRLNGGRPTIVPGLWVVGGHPHHVTQDQAIHFAQQSGLQFPHFPNAKAAEDWSIEREKQWGGVEPGDPDFAQAVRGVTPLWSRAPMSDQDQNVMGIMGRGLRDIRNNYQMAYPRYAPPGTDLPPR